MAKTGKNDGVNLLKTIMCFEVLVCHFLPADGIPFWQLPLVQIRTSAVPVFMMVSFLLCRNALVSGDPGALGKRLKRVLWPQVSWAVVYYIGCVLLRILDGEKPMGVDTLIWQLATGANEQLNPAMWFQVDLFILTLVFSLLFFVVNRRVGEGILLLIGAVCLALQYSRVVYHLFGPLRPEIKYSIGRLVEVWPFAAAGVCLFRPGMLAWMKKHWVLGCSGGLLLCGVSLAVKRPCTIADGFGYAGLHIVLVAVGLTVLFWSLPLEKLGGWVTGLIDRLSRYTLGIYCMHLLVAKVFDLILKRTTLPREGFWFCVAVFAAAYLVCQLLERSGKKWLIAMIH